jgi:hypothetical protein
MPIKRSPNPQRINEAREAKLAADNNRKPSDEDALVSTTYVPNGAYVVIAMDEAVDQHMVLFAPSGVESIVDRKVKVLARELTVADALIHIAKEVESDMGTVPKSRQNGASATKKVAAITKRGGTGPQKTSDPEAPWGRLPDGTPKQKPGRRPAVATASAKKTPATKKTLASKKATGGATKKVAAAKKRPSTRK